MIKFTWLKSLMPRSMFGRSLLILLFPVVLLQLVVGMVFIQRHFESVTSQMATPIAAELNFIAELVEETNSVDQVLPALETFSRPLSMQFDFVPDGTFFPEFRRAFYDVSGSTLIDSLTARVAYPISIDLTKNPRNVLIAINTNKGILNVSFSRNRVSASNPHQLLVLMIVASIILTIISVLFLRNQVRPIRELARVSEAFGKGRSDDFRPSGAIEVRRAGYAFLSMRTRLERQIEQRTQMLSGVSHDLRTPLTRMKLSLAMMDESSEVDQLSQDVADMQQMLDVFLDFARSDSIEDTVSTNVQQLIEKTVAAQREQNAVIQSSFKKDSGDRGEMMLRPIAISRAVSNLISNATRFGDIVNVSGNLSKDTFTITVEDNGPGIPVQDRAEAVKPFVRLDESRNQNQVSVGLGLAIVADIARSHGGKLDLLDSDSLGGLKIVLSVPR